jgi:hypothetical protein
MIPRALTWLHLLPADSSFDCGSGPSWVHEGLRACGTPGGRRVIVEYGPGNSPPSFEGAHAFVGVNCPSVSDAVLRRAGFGRIQRLAVLPGLENARWFVPLGRSAVSSAAFDLYTPARASARLKRLGARMMAHARLPFWYRDQICIAQRSASPLESAMGHLFPGTALHVALSSGAPDDARNRKVSAAVIDSTGCVLAFLKLARSPICRGLVRNEASVLRRLPGVLGEDFAAAPRLLFSGDVDGTLVTAQTPLPGRTVSGWGSAHHSFLKSLETRQVCPAAESQFVLSLQERIAALLPARPQLGAVLNSVMPELARIRLPITVIHGDFAPWNLRRRHVRLAAYDWEYGHLGGIPGVDESHYLLQSGYLLENWSIGTAIGRLRAAEARGGPSRAVQVVYLVDMLTRLAAEGYDSSNEMIDWKSRVLSTLAGATKEAVLV